MGFCLNKGGAAMAGRWDVCSMINVFLVWWYSGVSGTVMFLGAWLILSDIGRMFAYSGHTFISSRPCFDHFVCHPLMPTKDTRISSVFRLGAKARPSSWTT